MAKSSISESTGLDESASVGDIDTSSQGDERPSSASVSLSNCDVEPRELVMIVEHEPCYLI